MPSLLSRFRLPAADSRRSRATASVSTALRLARYFGVSAGIFLGLQADYDLMEQRRKLGAKLDEIKPRAA